MQRAPKEFQLEAVAIEDLNGFVARKFFFSPNTFAIPLIKELEDVWGNIPDPLARKAIATEHQYYLFHRFLLNAIQHQDEKDATYCIRIGLSVRVGAIKAARLVIGSITEAALRSHAEKRGFKLSSNDRKKTLGKLLTAWKEQSPVDSKEILALALKVHNARNDVHLYKSIHSTRDFAKLLESEAQAHSDDERLLIKLQALIS